ncbi:hypothetical protein Cgig2_018019 [Carnegiea gigantea]|uniref:Uncharacterized protein n=1 Tax=Carnegiea gigantea TaxID=171969 RepID=A0A9Q1GFC2_9CARY|nr:hypothetical protein Cgig2_018019 [Carnegiea gigantea]
MISQQPASADSRTLEEENTWTQAPPTPQIDETAPSSPVFRTVGPTNLTSSYASLVNPFEGTELKFIPSASINGNKCAKLDKADVGSGVEYWQNAVLCSTLGANLPSEVIKGFLNRIWADFSIGKILHISLMSMICSLDNQLAMNGSLINAHIAECMDMRSPLVGKRGLQGKNGEWFRSHKRHLLILRNLLPKTKTQRQASLQLQGNQEPIKAQSRSKALGNLSLRTLSKY